MDNQTNTNTATIDMNPPDATSHDRLLELERFAEIGRLSAGLLHEISSPLSAALLWLEQCNAQQSPYMSHVRSSIRLMQSYVEAARQQVRRESLCREFNVQTELEQVMSILSPVAARRGVTLDFAPANHMLHGDPVKFQQLLANLVRNAIDAYDSCPSVRHKPVYVRFRKDGRYLTLEVRDQGCGIPDDQFDKLFRPFYSTKADAGRGLGIGLFSVKRSVKDDFDGDINVSSLPDSGTSFVARFRIMTPGAPTPRHEPD